MNNAKIQLVVPRSVKTKLDDYVALIDYEISGLGEVEKVRDGVFRLKDIFLYKQKCTSATTSLENTDIHDFIVERLEQGKSVEHIKFWWHSHVNMGTFWSGQDENAIQNIENDYLISWVQNKRGEVKTRVDLFQPFRTTVNDLDIVIEEDNKLAVVAIPETEGILVPLKEALDMVASVLGDTPLHTINADRLSTSFLEIPEVYAGAAAVLRRYAELFEEGIKTSRQVAVKEEIDQKVSVSHYYSGYGYNSRTYNAKGVYSSGPHRGGIYDDGYGDPFWECWRNYYGETKENTGKDKKKSSNDYGLDLLPEFNKDEDLAFKEAMAKDERRDLLINRNQNVAIPRRWRSMREAGRNKR